MICITVLLKVHILFCLSQYFPKANSISPNFSTFLHQSSKKDELSYN